MSTIYTIGAQSVFVSANGNDRMLIHNTTEAKVGQLSMSSVRAYVLGQASTETLGFWGATASTQPTNADQADILSTAAVSIASAGTPWGYATSTQADGVVDLVRAIRAALVAAGLMKGS
jgi:hypothetical protein